jgi:hypothetical protein
MFPLGATRAKYVSFALAALQEGRTVSLRKELLMPMGFLAFQLTYYVRLRAGVCVDGRRISQQ